ncbi:MAG: AAC(3) family N-acetyltransferase [Planctomycetota bacterium]|nr:AAC(3) family N-acetyltransferase [Planctomycetota bacterium]
MKMKTIDGSPKTELSLREDILKIGIKPNATLMVHSSLRSIGWVLGGPSTLVQALLNVIGENGTLIMPAATPHCADPADWTMPQVPKAWLETAREHLPIFDPLITPTSLGAIPETFRTWPGTQRSNHPLESVCARGALAEQITQTHPLAFSEGRGGPFGKLYDLDSWILLIGVGFNRCTAMHFAESLVDKRRVTKVRFPVLDNCNRIWQEVPNVADDNDTHFPLIGQKYLEKANPRLGAIGEADCILLPMRELVDFAVCYFNEVL